VFLLVAILAEYFDVSRDILVTESLIGFMMAMQKFSGRASTAFSAMNRES
jgi:hypothetical protein